MTSSRLYGGPYDMMVIADPSTLEDFIEQGGELS
jgi:hypothetical protein